MTIQSMQGTKPFAMVGLSLILFIILGNNAFAAMPDELETIGGNSSYQYGPGDGVFIVELTDLPAEAGAGPHKYIKIANDITANGDDESKMPQFEVKIQRKADGAGAWSTVSTDELTDGSNSIASNFYNLVLSSSPGGAGGFDDHHIYSLNLRAINGGWAASQSGSAEERIKIGIKNNSSDARTYVGAAGNTEAEAEVGWIRVTPESINFGEVVAGRPASEVLPETFKIMNTGTGGLQVQNIVSPANHAFDTPSVAIMLDPLEESSEFEIELESQDPGFKDATGPVTDVMRVDNDSANAQQHDVLLSATAVNLELCLLFDISRSMRFELTSDNDLGSTNLPSRIYYAKEAARSLQALLNQFEGNTLKLGLYTFPKYGETLDWYSPASAEVVQEFTDVVVFSSSHWDAPPSGLDAIGGTPLAEGLHLAYGLSPFVETPLERLVPWTEGEFVRRSIIMFTDGKHTHDSSSYPHTPADWVDYLTSLSPSPSRAIKIYTIPYGPDILAEIGKLQDIATATGATMLDATVDPEIPDVTDFIRFAKAIRNAVTDWRDYTVVDDPPGTLTQGGPEKVHEVCIDDNIRRAAFIVDWDKHASNAVQFQLEGPNGVVSAGSPSVSFSNGPSYAMFVVSGDDIKGNAGSDAWRFKLSGGQGLSSGETLQYEYSVIAQTKTTMTTDFGSLHLDTSRKENIVSVHLRDPYGLSKKEMTIKAEYFLATESLANFLSTTDGFDNGWLAIHDDKSNQPISSKAKVAPMVINGEPATPLQRKVYALKHFAKRTFFPHMTKAELQLADNGLNGDKVAGDGIYSATLPRLLRDGMMKVDFYFGDDSECGSNSFARQLHLAQYVNVAILPNLLKNQVKVLPVEQAIAFKDLIEPGLKKSLNTKATEGRERKAIVVNPEDEHGNKLGPGQAHKVKFQIDEKTKTVLIGGVVDNLDGSYAQIVEFQSGTAPEVETIVDGVSGGKIALAEIVPQKSEKVLWWVMLVLISVLVIFIIRKRKTA